jgi:hypothetical protein
MFRHNNWTRGAWLVDSGFLIKLFRKFECHGQLRGQGNIHIRSPFRRFGALVSGGDVDYGARVFTPVSSGGLMMDR